MKDKIIYISGKDRSGKSKAAEILQTMGYKTFECGGVVRREYEKLIDIEQILSISDFYQSEEKQLNSLIYQEIKDLINNSTPDLKMAIVGVRSMNLFSILTQKFPPLFILYILSHEEIRYQRHLDNNKGFDKLSLALFKFRDIQQQKWGLEDIMRKSEIIENNSSIIRFEENLKEIYAKRCL